MMERDERELFARSLEHALEHHTGAGLDAHLAEVGWLDALAADTRTAIATFFEIQGRANATSGALDDVLAHALEIKTDGPVAVILPPMGHRHPPAVFVDDHLTVDGLGTATLDRRDTAVVVGHGEQATVIGLAPTRHLTARSVTGIDPALAWSHVSGCLARAGGQDISQSAWDQAVATGQLAIGHELVGASRAMLALARDHAAERVQFGRPIGSFQAVRHRLAEAYVAVESADAALAAAWDAPSPRNAAMAKAVAGRSARTVARHGQQVLAGMGFTTDHPFHRAVRRVLVLDQVLGSSRTLTRELGEDLVVTRQLPGPLPL
jgi:hypothetical protein